MTSKIAKTIEDLRATGTMRASSKTLYDIGRSNGMSYKGVQEAFFTDENRVSRGLWDLSRLNAGVKAASADDASPVVKSRAEGVAAPPPKASRASALVETRQKTFATEAEEVFIPDVNPTFVPWGDYNNVKAIIASRKFFPIFVSGLSGNGKTIMVEQACAKTKREYVRVQISPDTDEADLLGSFRLVDGETVFYKGPVIKAMERGAILLLDEIDRGSNKIMCLQGVLEGKPVLIKKIGLIVTPAPGFNVITTANTKGRGSEDGRFTAANIIDDAFLERFGSSIDQPYPNAMIEKKILMKHMHLYGAMDEPFADKLVAWSQTIRKTYEEDGVDDVISTRRLCFIVQAFSIFKNRFKSIAMCIKRFDEDTVAAFVQLYSAIDSEASSESANEPTDDEDDVPQF